jgi:hypothetical protein
MEPWELIEKLKSDLDKVREENKKLKETNFKLLGRVSKYTEQLEKYEQALYRICSDESVTWEQTEVIAKRALGLSPFDKERRK